MPTVLENHASCTPPASERRPIEKRSQLQVDVDYAFEPVELLEWALMARLDVEERAMFAQPIIEARARLHQLAARLGEAPPAPLATRVLAGARDGIAAVVNDLADIVVADPGNEQHTCTLGLARAVQCDLQELAGYLTQEGGA